MRVYLTGGDGAGWATDDDLQLLRTSLTMLSDLTLVEDPASCDVVHSVNWYSLYELPETILKQKLVISHLSHDIRFMLEKTEYLGIAGYVDLWITQSAMNTEFARLMGLPHVYVPYSVDSEKFFPISDKASLRAKYGLPADAFVIGSFQRDTEGGDLKKPKIVKGPDILAASLGMIRRSIPSLHILLAGSRRHWIVAALTKYGIPFTMVGHVPQAGIDDYPVNNQGHATINELYNACDIYGITSRLEGGPKAVLECRSSRTKVFSTDVGIASEYIEPQYIVSSIIAISEVLIEEYRTPQPVEVFYTGRSMPTPESNSRKWEAIYNGLRQRSKGTHSKSRTPSLKGKDFEINIAYSPRSGPWGGGNQFLKALAKGLERIGKSVQFSTKSIRRANIVNSFHISRRQSLLLWLFGKCVRVTHRIDGPTFLIRGRDLELDKQLFQFNKKIADVSVFQSFWSLIETYRLGFNPKRPVLVANTPDPDIFFHRSRQWRSGTKLKIIGSSWSSNPRKGLDAFLWLDENINFDLYDVVFVGNIDADFKNISVIPPVGSEDLGILLRESDVYFAPSENDPCSNALIEAIVTGLPVVFRKSGGHPELVGFGGLGYREYSEIPELLAQIAANYEFFQSLLTCSDIEHVAQQYARTFTARLS